MSPDKNLKHNNMQKQIIQICVPTLSGAVQTGFLEWLETDIWPMNQEELYPWHFPPVMYTSGIGPVAYARNKMVQKVLDERPETDKILMIDADEVPGPGAADIFITEADIVSGVTFYPDVKDDKNLIIPNIYKHSGIGSTHFPVDLMNHNGASVIDIDAAGTGCLLVDMKVFRDPLMHLNNFTLPASPGELPYADKEGVHAWFRSQYKPNGALETGEDIDFTMRAKMLGYTIKASLRARFGHIKTIMIDNFLNL
jgi:hypothetical protein